MGFGHGNFRHDMQNFGSELTGQRSCVNDRQRSQNKMLIANIGMVLYHDNAGY